MSDTVWVIWEWNNGDDTGDFLIGACKTQDDVVRRHQEDGYNIDAVRDLNVQMNRNGIRRYAHPLRIWS